MAISRSSRDVGFSIRIIERLQIRRLSAVKMGGWWMLEHPPAISSCFQVTS
nr:MAG TPA: hypothetical protein [Caudoviricetes sp.]